MQYLYLGNCQNKHVLGAEDMSVEPACTDFYSHTVQASWWGNPACSGLHVYDAAVPTRQQTGLSRSGLLSSSSCTPVHKVQLSE